MFRVRGGDKSVKAAEADIEANAKAFDELSKRVCDSISDEASFMKALETAEALRETGDLLGADIYGAALHAGSDTSATINNIRKNLDRTDAARLAPLRSTNLAKEGQKRANAGELVILNPAPFFANIFGATESLKQSTSAIDTLGEKYDDILARHGSEITETVNQIVSGEKKPIQAAAELSERLGIPQGHEDYEAMGAALGYFQTKATHEKLLQETPALFEKLQSQMHQ